MGPTDYGINWADFADNYDQNARGGVGGGEGVPSDLEALNKALSAGDGQAVAGEGTAGALKPLMPESLDGTLTSLTYDQEDTPFWAKLSKSRAYNTAEQFNQLLKVGQGEGGFIAEGDLPDEEDSTFRRNVTLIKYLGVTRRVTLQASMVRTVGVDNAIASETRDGTVWLMRVLEDALFFGDSSLVPVQFDGLKAQLIAGGAPSYDMRGLPLTVKIVNGMAGAAREDPNFGKIDTIFSSIGVRSDLINDQLSLMRARFGEKVVLGLSANKIETMSGLIDLIDDVFIREGRAPHADGLGKTNKRPLTPVANGALTHPAAPAGTSQWLAGDLGAYIYKVVGLNRYGRSTPMTTAAVTPDAAGDEIQIPVADGGQGTTAYIVYRSTKGGAASTAKEAFRVARTGATQTILDRNADLPGTSTAFGLTFKADVLQWKQLAPFTKIPLATVDTSIRWMMILFGALQVKSPRKNFMLINVGRDPNSPLLSQEVGLAGW